MRKSLGVLVLVAILLAGTAGGLYWWRVGRFVESTDDAYLQADISAISPEVEGYVRAVRVTDNQPVKRGDVLVMIDDRDFAAKLEQARGNRDAARAALAMLETRRTWQKAVIEQATASLASAGAELQRAALELVRQRNLAKADVASRQKFEAAVADDRKAEAGMSHARAVLAAERDQLAMIEAEHQRDEARLRQAEAALTLVQNELDDTVIRAPIDGVVGNKGVQIGQYVKPGTLLMALVPLPKIYVVANFKETQLAGMRPGQKVRVTVDAVPGRRLEGFIESFAPASGSLFSLLPPENATGNFTKIVQRVPVRIALAPDAKLRSLLRPGLSAEVEVDTRAPASLAAADAALAR